MKRIWIAVLVCVLVLGTAVPAALAAGVWQIRLEGEISPSQAVWLSEAYGDARSSGAERVLLTINTPGGRIDSAMTMASTIGSFPTTALVDGGAYSAGALLAFAAEEYYMTGSSVIGAAEPRVGEEKADEKTVSAWSAALAAEAEKNGRDPRIARAMADGDIAIEGLVEKGKLLTLTAGEALEFGMTDGVYADFDSFLEDMDFQVLGRSSKNTRDVLADFLTSAFVSTLLLTVGLGGIVIEMFTPGFGFPGGIGLTALALYFGGSMLAGISGWEAILLFLLGLILLVVEVFVLPGFGVAGISGFAAVFVSVFLATPDPATAVKSLVIALLGAIVLAVVLLRFLPSRKVLSRLVLSMGETPERGYVAPDTSLSAHVGKRGVAVSNLRPAGTIELEDRFVDVVTSGEFIAQGTPVEVIEVEGMRVVVKEIREEMK